MKRRVPLIPTIIVAAAVATMIALGMWQLDRARERDAMRAQIERNSRLPIMALPQVGAVDESILYRRATAFCLEVVAWRKLGGRSASGKGGTRFIAECRSGVEGPGFAADMGVSQDPKAQPSWRGGEVTGTVVAEPSKEGLWNRLLRRSPPGRPMIVSRRPAPNLEASVAPSPRDNSSWGYTFQWFMFAFIAATTYILALRRRSRRDPAA